VQKGVLVGEFFPIIGQGRVIFQVPANRNYNCPDKLINELNLSHHGGENGSADVTLADWARAKYLLLLA
jgi:hypothetical protein